MLEQFDQHLRDTDLLPTDSGLVVAVSGGVDSVALLDLLSRLQPRWGWHISVAHLDHGVRPDSTEDAQLVSQLADIYGHKFFLNQLDAGAVGSEATMRRARYDFLESVRQGVEADLIVTAHQADDKLETAVFNAIRGADRYGLTSLRPSQGVIVRPLLPYSKGKLITYAALRELPYRYDSSNSDVTYSRNFVRHNLLSQASVVDPSFRSQRLATINQLSDLTDKIDWQLSSLLDSIAKPAPTTKSAIAADQVAYTLDRRAFLQLPPLIQGNLLSYMARQLTGGLGLSRRNLARGLSFLATATTGSTSNAIPHLILERNYDNLVVAQSDNVELQAQLDQAESSATRPLQLDQPLTAASFRLYLRTEPVPAATANFLVKPSTYYVRGWQKGDRIAPIGMTGHRKLQDIFTDHKIPRRQRTSWPVVVDGHNQPVWVVGLGFDRTFLADPSQSHYQLSMEPL